MDRHIEPPSCSCSACEASQNLEQEYANSYSMDNVGTPTAIADTGFIINPSYYAEGGIETIDFINAKKLGYELGCAVKYISRAGRKDSNKTVEDLEKAIGYIQRAIKNHKEGRGIHVQ